MSVVECSVDLGHGIRIARFYGGGLAGESLFYASEGYRISYARLPFVLEWKGAEEGRREEEEAVCARNKVKELGRMERGRCAPMADKVARWQPA